MNDSRRGNVAVETAISFSITLIFICSIISVIVFCRTGILMQRSVEQECEQISLLPPTTVVYTDTVSTLVNAFPGVDTEEGSGADTLGKIASYVTAVDRFTGNTLEDLLLEGTLAHIMANDIRAGFIERNNGSEFFVPDSIDVDLNIDRDHHVMEVEVTYETVTLAGRIQRIIYSTVPLYGDADLFLNPGGNEEADNIWSSDNFTRGDYFRREYDSNLPKTFPVIDSYEGGVCSSVVSIDLTAPTYEDPSKITSRIQTEIDNIADFNGADMIISGSRYHVDGGGITGRVLTVVIPSNSSGGAKDQIQALRSYAALRGVDINVEEHGESHRYIN